MGKICEMINIFILIDALGWSYIKDRPFLNDIATIKIPVKSILGFSSGVIPSILTGKYPQEHKHWSLYYYSPKTSPFRWIKALLWLPDTILNSRITRKVIEEISKRLMGYSGYFETYLIPIRQLYLFDICEKKNIYATKGLKESKSIFDILNKQKTNYKCLSYPLKDKDIIDRTREALRENKSNFYFLYLSEFDALLHSNCPIVENQGPFLLNQNKYKSIETVPDFLVKNQTKINEAINNYEKEIQEVYQIAKDKSQEVDLYIFSDHGMAHVNKSEDLKVEIEKLEFKTPKDYVAFYDSTMARFWFYNPKAKNAILELLKTKNCGRILAKNELKNLGIDFKDNMYGETIFLMNTGVVINPSYMGNKTPQGMHGFDIKDSSMDAVLVSNCEIKEKIEDVKDIFKIMVSAIKQGDSPLRGQSPIKILYFLNSVVKAGVEEHVLGLLKNINRGKFEPILACPQELLDLLQEDIENLGIRSYPVCIRRWRNIGQIREFIKILKIEKPDIVNSHLFFATMFAAPLAKFSGVPKVIETAHLREAWRKGIKRMFFIDRLFYCFVDKIIAVSYAVKKYMVDDKGIDAKKIEIIHNGVDLEKFKPTNQGDSPLRGQSPFTIGVIGRLEPQKGHKYFLEAIHLLNSDYKDVRFVIAGNGSLRNDLEEQALKLGIADRIEFLGYRKDIVNVLQDIDLLVLPSLYEGLPLVVLEAGAMGKPVIATNVDGSPEAVINKKTGLIIPPMDSSTLKDALELFLADRNLARELGQNAIIQITENFSLKKQVVKTEELYQ